MGKIYKRQNFRFFKNFSYKFIRLKYFILIVGAMLLEIIVLVIYIINNENIVYFDLFTGGILYGFTSIIVVVLALGCLVLILTDRSRNKNRIKKFNDFRRSYFKLSNEYTREIDELVKRFDEEKDSFETKINYAINISEKYNDYSKEFSKIRIPGFLSDAFNYESDHLNKEKLFFTRFSLLSKRLELEKINKESDLAHQNFKRELNNIEKNLRLII